MEIPSGPFMKLYKDLAWCYEFITEGKEHKKEAEFVMKKVKGKELLDVGCGHGWHDKFLKRKFKVTGINLHKPILQYAKKRNPEVKYLLGDMKTFNLKKKFDVVLSFDAMMYNLTYKDLKKTLKNLSRHLKDDGILIFHLDKLKENFVQNKIIHCGKYKKRKKELIFFQIDFDENPKDTKYETFLTFIFSEKGKLIRKTDRHEMGLFELKKIKQILKDLGFKTTVYDFSGKKYTRDSKVPVFLCVKK